MGKDNWHNEMDDWLNKAMNDLPKPDVADFEAFEAKRKGRVQKKGLLWFSSALAILLVFSLVYQSDFGYDADEKRMYVPSILEQPEQEQNKNLSAAARQNNTGNSKTDLTPSITLKSTSTEKPKPATFKVNGKTKTEKSPSHKPKIKNQAFVLPTAFELKNVQPQYLAFKSDPKVPFKREASLNLFKPEHPKMYSMYNSSTDFEGLFADEKVSINISMYPNYTFRDLKILGVNYDKVHKDYLTIIKASEKGGMAINIGADVKYKVKTDLFLGTGLYYIQTKITGSFNFEITEDPIINPATEEILGYQPAPEGTYVNQGILNTYNYLQVPIVISYQPWLTKRLRMVVEGGTSYLRFLKAQGTTIDYQDLRPVELQRLNYNKNLFTLNFKIGVNYYLTKQLALGLEPTFLYFNNSIYGKDYPIYMVPWSVGVNFSMKIRLQ